MTGKLTSVSVDIDEVHHYFAIHGLPIPATAARAAYDVALPRLGAFAEARGIPLTFFAVGEDLARPESASTLRVLATRGHAVESHSLSHRYDLTRLTRDEIASEVEQGARVIAHVTGRRPAGFRAPGYTVSDDLFDALEDAGVAYDSSVFPCPPYYFAKAAAMAAMRITGRTSRSILDTPRVLGAPTRPYRPGRPWYQRGTRRFVELPIQVTPGLRLPFIGTSVALLGNRGARWLARRCAGEAFVNLELHAMDFLDAADGLEALLPHQPELRIPVARRIAALGAALDVLAAAGHAFVTLEEAARAVAR
ncbi:polysaccharide deacetylase [Minicystis rosea]|nr:polysaccharide deacetylase [Minicystis rosea]